MNEQQKKVLDFLEKNLEEDEYEGGAYFSFAPICNATGLDRKTVRLACRYLKRKGLARFYAGLWDNDGGFRGSGYSAFCLSFRNRTSPVGVKKMSKLDELKNIIELKNSALEVAISNFTAMKEQNSMKKHKANITLLIDQLQKAKDLL